MKKAVGREWSHMLGKVAHVDPCVCGGTPVLELERSVGSSARTAEGWYGWPVL